MPNRKPVPPRALLSGVRWSEPGTTPPRHIGLGRDFWDGYRGKPCYANPASYAAKAHAMGVQRKKSDVAENIHTRFDGTVIYRMTSPLNLKVRC